MMIPFLYTRYKNSVLASVISLIGSVFIVGGVFLGVAFVAETVTGNSGKAVNVGELIGGVACGIIFAAIGWLLTCWARKIAEKKLRKELEKTKKINTSAAASGRASGGMSGASVCSHCGNPLAPDDVFCFKCGTRRGN